MLKKSIVLRGAAASLAIQALNVGLAFGGSVILAQVMAPARFGVYAFVLSFATVLTLPAQFGAPILALREVAAAKARGDFPLMKGLMRRLHQFATFAGLGLGLAAAAVALFTPWGRSDPATVLWGVALIPLVPLAALRGGILRGLGAVAHGQWPDLVLKPAVFLLGASLVLAAGWKLGPDEAMALTVLSTAAGLGVGMVLYWRVRPAELDAVEPRYQTRAWLLGLVPMGLTGGAVLVNGQIGILLSGLAGAETTGLYRIALQTSLVAGLGYTAVIAALGPRFAAAHARDDRRGLQRAAALGAALSTLACLPFLAVFAVAGGPLMGLVFGAPFAAGGQALLLLTLAQLLNALFGAASSALIMTGRERPAAAAFLAALAVHTGLGLLLIPRWGLEGAAWAYLGQMAAMNLILWVLAKRLLGLETGIWGLLLLRKGRDAQQG